MLGKTDSHIWRGIWYHGRSHTRTVVRECCKGDDESQWERGKFRVFGSAHAWFRTPRDSATFFGVLEKGYSRDACTDFDAKFVKRRGSAQGSAFWGSRKQNLRFRPPLSPKTAIQNLGPISTGFRIFSPENGFNIGRLESKRPLNVVVAQREPL